MEYEEALCRVSEALRAHNKVKGGISSREACELILEAVRPKGEWIKHPYKIWHSVYECSQCGNIIDTEFDEDNFYFCDKCGADMKNEADDDTASCEV